MKIWNQAPLVRLLLPFIAGIITAVYLPFQYNFGIYVICALSLIISLVVLIPKLNFSYRKSGWFGLLVNVTLFASAFQLTILKTEILNPNHFSKFIDSTSFVYARLNDSYLEKEKSLKVVVQILAVKRGKIWINTSGKAMVYLKKDANSLQLAYGDGIVLKVDFKDVPPPQNPGEFNYKRFLAFHNVFHQAYVKDKDWVNCYHNTGSPLMSYSINLRNRLLKIFIANHLQGDEFAVGSALLLGYVDKLDADIISAYSSTGALHVLSVSGLHVAIVYIVFNWFLFFLDKVKYGNIIKAVVLILFLWFYAILTGSSPSVLRSASMLSFIIVAKAFNRNTNIYNTLAASAFLLFLINPYLIMDVGFQLSYLAVIGIVYIQPKIYNWFEVNNWLLDQVWTITSVSIAAQIATFPLGLHYFHQFPNYFLLSNFIVIPVSTVIIYLGIALFVFAKISMIASYLAIAFNWSIWLLNSSVKVIEKWPYSLLRGISISVFETWLIYSLIIIFFFYFAKQKFSLLIYAFSLTIVILFSQIVEQRQQVQQKKIIVYNIPKTSAMDFISSNNNVLLTDSAFANNESALLFRVKHNWWDLGITNSTIKTNDFSTTNLIIKKNYILFYSKKIVIINEQSKFKKITKTFQSPIIVDYLVISKNPNVRLTDILKLVYAKKIIFDSSNSEYRINKWKTECVKLNQPYYSVIDSGAYIEDI